MLSDLLRNKSPTTSVSLKLENKQSIKTIMTYLKHKTYLKIYLVKYEYITWHVVCEYQIEVTRRKTNADLQIVLFYFNH